MEYKLREMLPALVLLVASAGVTVAAPTEGAMMGETETMAYLTQYGYAGEANPDPRVASLMTSDPQEAMSVGLQIFQHRYGLEVTGEMDEATSTLMRWPRCGNTDISSMEDMMSMDGQSMRKRRYLVQGNAWPRTDLTYNIQNYPQDQISRDQVDAEIARAFKVWSDVTPLTFTRNSRSDADILIRFAYYDHGDGNSFDGPGTVLAHAYLPFSGSAIEGDTHFDDSETWTLYTRAGTNLFQVAAHEFGHALGLGHSEDQTALMAPFYRGYIPDFRLPSDDILGIRSLYGERTGGRGDMTTPSTGGNPMTFPPGVPNFCDDSGVDAVTSAVEGGVERLLFFKRGYYAALGSNGIAEGYPRAISTDWSGLPDDIDAALYLDGYTRSYYTWSWETYSYTRHTDTSPAYTLFFRGAYYYIFTDDRAPVGGARPVSELGMPEDTDAAFIWTANGGVYVMKGSQYYRFERQTDGGVLLSAVTGYPRPLSNWNLGLDSVDAALKTSGEHNYFFNDGLFYRYDSSNYRVADGFPAALSNVFGCQNNLHSGGVSGESDDDMASGADAQTIPYVTFMSVNCVMMLLALCVL